jgi:hypothetical protein
MFSSPPQQGLAAAAVRSLIEEIEQRTKTVRNNQPITLTAFLKSKDEADFVAGLSPSPDDVEAGFWGPAGVGFTSLPALLAGMQAGKGNAHAELGRGLEALLSVSHVVVIVCPTRSGADEVRGEGGLLSAYPNTSALIALLVVEDGKREFLEIGPEQKAWDSTDWILEVTGRWEIETPDEKKLPPVRKQILGRIFPWLASFIRRRSESKSTVSPMFRAGKKGKSSDIERCQGGMGISKRAIDKLEAPDVELLKHNVSLLCPFFARHDDLGLIYGNVFRTVCLLVPVLIAVSTVLAAMGVIDPQRHVRWHVIEGGLLMLAAALYFSARLRLYHDRWVEHRLICELMRSALMTNLLHTVPRLSPPNDDAGLWKRQTPLFWIYLRSLPICSWSTSTAALLSARRSAVADYANSQRKYHDDFARQHFAIHKWLVRRSGWAFLATLVLVVVQLVLAFLEAKKLPDLEFLVYWPARLMILTLSFACGAFVLSLLAHQLGFERIGERSASAAREFQILIGDIEREAASTDAQKVYAWADRCAEIIWGEQLSWYRHVPFIQMHL